MEFDVFIDIPFIDSAGDFDFLGICLRNCAQCKKMYGSYFEGQMCADSCVKYKGKIIPGKLPNASAHKCIVSLIVRFFSIIAIFRVHWKYDWMSQSIDEESIQLTHSVSS